jgi:hypothetical protein
VIDLALAVVVAALGLIALPLVFGSAVVVWLVAAVVLAICLLVLIPRLSRPVAFAMQAHLSSSSTVTPSQTRLVAQLLVVGIALLVVQAILRRPLSLVLGGQIGATTYEASIAATGLTLVLAIAVWLYQTARPVVQAATLRAINVAIPTVETAPLAEPTRTLSVADATVRAPVVDDQATVRAPLPQDEPTIRAPLADPDATLRVERPPA